MRLHESDSPQTSQHQNSKFSHPKATHNISFLDFSEIKNRAQDESIKAKKRRFLSIGNSFFHKTSFIRFLILFRSILFPAGKMGRHHAPNRDSADEQHALQWIFAILGEPVPPGPFEEILRNGNVLCRFMQRIRPDLLPKFSQSEQPAKQRENISLFTNAAAALGVPTTDLFQTIDLFEGKDPSSIAHCLARLGGILQRDRPDLPVHGPKLSEAQQKEFTAQQLAPGKMHY